MSASDEPFVMTKELPALKDHHYRDWLMNQFFLACKREHRWKTHLDQSHGVHEYQNAVRMKRCIRECAAYELQDQEWQEAMDKVSNILGASMARNEISPATYQAVIDTLHAASVRR